MSSLKTKATVESGGDNAQMYDKDGLPIYGMDLEIQKKLQSKKDPYREAEAQEWIESVTGEKFSEKDFQKSLKNGVLLCKLINSIRPKMIKKISKANRAFMQMNNIQAFLRACAKLGVPKTDCFVTIDLYEGKNIPAVVDTIFSLGSICMELKDYKGPTIGKKRSKKTKYEFTEEQLAQSKNAGTLLSFGGKGCASQAGTRSISNEVVKSKDSGTRGAVSKLNEGGKGCSSQAGTRSIHNEVVRSKDGGTRGAVSKLNEGGKGCSSQAGTRSIHNEVVRSKDGGARGVVSKLNEGSKGCSSQSGNRSISHEVVKVDNNTTTQKKEESESEEEETKQEETKQEETKKDDGEEVEIDNDVEVEVDEEEGDDEDEDDSDEDTSLEELEKLAAKRDAGEITEEEFAAKKKEILGL